MQKLSSDNDELNAVPTHIICPKCQSPTSTNVEIKNTSKTHLLAFLMCIVGCCLCAWLPYTINGEHNNRVE